MLNDEEPPSDEEPMPGKGSLAALVDHYVDSRHRQGEITSDVRDRLRSILQRFAESYGGRDPRKLSLADIERWLESRSALAQSSRRTEWSTVRCFVRWLAQHGHLRRDPLIGRKAPKLPRSAGRALSADECAAIEAVLPDARAWAIYALMRWVGLRRSEVCRVQVGDWDRRAGTLHVIGKGGNERIEPVPPWVEARLDAYLAESGGVRAGFLIRSVDGTTGIGPSYVSQMTARWMREAGVKERAHDGRGPHSLRHTIASELSESGADVRVVQELLGHASLQSTQVYLRKANTARVLDAMHRAKGPDAAEVA